MHSNIKALQSVMPAPVVPDFNLGDWAAVETALGTELPNDYKAFISTFGSGMIGKLPIHVLSVFAPMFSLIPMIDGVRKDYEYVADIPYPLFPAPGGLLVCAVTGNGDYIHWLTTGHPDRWPVVVFECGGEFHHFPLTLSGFLLAVLRHQLDPPVLPPVLFEPPVHFVQYTDPSLPQPPPD